MKIAGKVIATTLLGVAVGFWSQYPEDFQTSDLNALGMTFGGVIGLLLARYFAPLITTRAFGCAFLFSAFAAWAAGIGSYENRFYRADAVAWAGGLGFFFWCFVAYGLQAGWRKEV